MKVMNDIAADYSKMNNRVNNELLDKIETL